MAQKYGVLNRRFHSILREKKEKTLCFYGGSGSSKSVSIGQHICNLAISGEKLRIAVIRKTLPSLRVTAYRLIQDILNDWGVPFNHNKTDRVIRIKSSEIYFTGLDDPEKIKSAEFSYIWIEEATDLDKEDYMQLLLRLERTAENPQIFLSFNPIDAYHWLITDVVQGGDPDVFVHHSTYKDNLRFLSDTFVKELEKLAEKDENFYRVYTLGEPGVLENIIYKKYDMQPFPKQPQIHAYGIDFGYNHPTAVTEIAYADTGYFIRELLYQTEMTNDDLIAWMNTHNIDKRAEIYADSAEPARIESISRAGYNIYPADKSVKDGIDFVKSQSIHIDPASVNLLKEIRNYKYKKDKNGVVLDEPVKAFDHGMDSIRYCLYSMPTRPGTAVPVDAVSGGHRAPLPFGKRIPGLFR